MLLDLTKLSDAELCQRGRESYKCLSLEYHRLAHQVGSSVLGFAICAWTTAIVIRCSLTGWHDLSPVSMLVMGPLFGAGAHSLRRFFCSLAWARRYWMYVASCDTEIRRRQRLQEGD